LFSGKQSFIKAGFTESEAMQLVCAWLAAMMTSRPVA